MLIAQPRHPLQRLLRRQEGYAAVAGIPNVPPTSSGLQSKRGTGLRIAEPQQDDQLLNQRANRSDLSLFYSSMGSSVSVASFSPTASTSTTSGARRIIPLYNLSTHNVLQNTVQDAGKSSSHASGYMLTFPTGTDTTSEPTQSDGDESPCTPRRPNSTDQHPLGPSDQRAQRRSSFSGYDRTSYLRFLHTHNYNRNERRTVPPISRRRNPSHPPTRNVPSHRSPDRIRLGPPQIGQKLGAFSRLVGAGGIDMVRVGIEVGFEWVRKKKKRELPRVDNARPVGIVSVNDNQGLPRRRKYTFYQSWSSFSTQESSSSDDGDKSGPEDSETPWNCTFRVVALDGSLSPLKLRLAHLVPAPHHPQVIGKFKTPLPLPDVKVQQLELIPRSVEWTREKRRGWC
ncbi:hypothetical protein RSOLAG22IIIB_11065 [Rhizoctonia solani]|uniref:Uncharacterized protein n=1 Tax=Rhizoctonia solani TaxID=456999 RepID=A0A0K6G6G6_9AGAM|nr:hypothetical protein RSOLAG22IIIB_11065 [Rhizoctonia solani]